MFIIMEVIKKCAITSTANKIYYILSTLHTNEDIKKQLVSLDLEVSIKNMELLIDNLYNSEFKNNQLRKSIQYILPLINERHIEKLNIKEHIDVINKYYVNIII